MQIESIVAARRAWHAAAELLLAGPQYRSHGTIRLRIVPGGFATVTGPEVRVEVDAVVAGDLRVPLVATTYAAAGTALGIEAGGPGGGYPEGSGAQPGGPGGLDPAAARDPARRLALGGAAPRRVA